MLIFHTTMLGHTNVLSLGDSDDEFIKTSIHIYAFLTFTM